MSIVSGSVQLAAAAGSWRGGGGGRESDCRVLTFDLHLDTFWTGPPSSGCTGSGSHWSRNAAKHAGKRRVLFSLLVDICMEHALPDLFALDRTFQVQTAATLLRPSGGISHSFFTTHLLIPAAALVIRSPLLHMKSFQSRLPARRDAANHLPATSVTIFCQQFGPLRGKLLSI